MYYVIALISCNCICMVLGAEQCWSTSIHNDYCVLSFVFLAFLFFKFLFLFACFGRSTEYLRLHSDAQVNDDTQWEFSDIMRKTYIFPLSDVPLVGWLGPWPCGQSNRSLDTCLVVSGRAWWLPNIKGVLYEMSLTHSMEVTTVYFSRVTIYLSYLMRTSRSTIIQCNVQLNR